MNVRSVVAAGLAQYMESYSIRGRLASGILRRGARASGRKCTGHKPAADGARGSSSAVQNLSQNVMSGCCEPPSGGRGASSCTSGYVAAAQGVSYYGGRLLKNVARMRLRHVTAKQPIAGAAACRPSRTGRLRRTVSGRLHARRAARSDETYLHGRRGSEHRAACVVGALAPYNHGVPPAGATQQMAAAVVFNSLVCGLSPILTSVRKVHNHGAAS